MTMEMEQLCSEEIRLALQFETKKHSLKLLQRKRLVKFQLSMFYRIIYRRSIAVYIKNILQLPLYKCDVRKQLFITGVWNYQLPTSKRKNSQEEFRFVATSLQRTDLGFKCPIIINWQPRLRAGSRWGLTRLHKPLVDFRVKALSKRKGDRDGKESKDGRVGSILYRFAPLSVYAPTEDIASSKCMHTRTRCLEVITLRFWISRGTED
jgi:hypothetical protein